MSSPQRNPGDSTHTGGSVVCCVDESQEARDAARFGKLLADRLGLQLVLLHVAAAPIAPGVSTAAHGQERLAAAERESADELLEAVALELGLGNATERRVEFGDVAARVLAVVEEGRAELVVLGSRGRGSLKTALLGSVSKDVVGRAPCVVVVVPPGAAARSSLV
jgi:nucleotide-binding universal stress UspA family protein